MSSLRSIVVTDGSSVRRVLPTILIDIKGTEKRPRFSEFRFKEADSVIIGHSLENDFGLRRNFLKGLAGDQINLILAAAAFNLKK